MDHGARGRSDRSRRSRTRRSTWKPGDTIIDGGNSYFKDDVRRAKELKDKGIHYVDVGTSGGVWGLERGYCLMIGGPKEAVQQLDPIFKTLAPGTRRHSRTPGREERQAPPKMAISTAGLGAGHFVKMVHNGIEYGLMQAYAEGFDIFKNADQQGTARRASLRSRISPDIAEVWRRGSVVSSWLLDLTAMALAENPTLSRVHRLRAGFRRRPLDHSGGHRRSRARRRLIGRALSCASARGRNTLSPRRCCPRCARNSAATSKQQAPSKPA